MSRIVSLPEATRNCYANPQRIVALDLAKGFTVLFIPIIHVFMLYSTPVARQGLIGYALKFVAEWPGAQLLMFVMGMSFSFSKKSMQSQLKRAMLIFIAGYVLNAFKFLGLYWLCWMPDGFINDLQFSHPAGVSMHLFLIGDILQFAGISLAILAIIKKSGYPMLLSVLISYLVIIGSSLMWNWHHEHAIIDQLLHLVGGSVPDAFFPIVPWIVYPLTGFAIGAYLFPRSSKYRIYFLKRGMANPFIKVRTGNEEGHEDLRQKLVPIFISGAALFIGGYCMQFLPWHFPEALFWRTYPDKTLMHLGFVMMWVGGWLRVTGYGLQVNMVIRLLSFCGRRITVIYLVQWVVIFWMLTLFGYQCLDVGESLIAASLIYIIVFGITYLIGRKGRKEAQRTQRI
jgi:uncharacterized membrane protein